MTRNDGSAEDGQGGPHLTIDATAMKFAISAFGWTTEDGVIVEKETGEPVPDHRGREVHVDNCAGIVTGEDRDAIPIPAEFTALVDLVESRGATADA